MNMHEIATELGKLYQALRLLEVAKAHKEADLAGRKLFLTPAEGWPGKNDGERKTAAEKAWAKDDTCKALATLIRENEGQIAEMLGQCQALEAERRAQEWNVRVLLIEALRGAHVNPNGHGPIEETAFDDVTQAEMDAAMQSAAEETFFAGGPYPEGMPGPAQPDDDDFPF